MEDVAWIIFDFLGSGIKGTSCHVPHCKGFPTFGKVPTCSTNVVKVNELNSKGKLEFAKRREFRVCKETSHCSCFWPSRYLDSCPLHQTLGLLDITNFSNFAYRKSCKSYRAIPVIKSHKESTVSKINPGNSTRGHYFWPRPSIYGKSRGFKCIFKLGMWTLATAQGCCPWK